MQHIYERTQTYINLHASVSRCSIPRCRQPLQAGIVTQAQCTSALQLRVCQHDDTQAGPGPPQRSASKIWLQHFKFASARTARSSSLRVGVNFKSRLAQRAQFQDDESDPPSQWY